ncbi:MAG: helix-turn-helix domain-containing protein [Marinobacterium sp.]|nr:helix-turn-helix domain-containing protein [Marinobacterium sp.]
MKTLGERIAYIQSRTGTRKLQEAAGIPQSTLSRYIRNQSEPSVERMVAMAKAGNVSAGWLAAGEGEAPANASGFLQLQSIREDSTGHILFDSNWLAQLAEDTNQLRTFRHRSDAMESTISQGSLIIIDTSQTTPCDSIFLLRLAGELSIKRVQAQPDGSLSLISDNAAYQTHTLLPDEQNLISIEGRVIWYETTC